jgi:hypothetical protein
VVDPPVDSAEGVVRAVIHRRDDDDDKLVLIPEGVTLDDAETKAAVDFHGHRHSPARAYGQKG